jgi:hypothetical protein
VINERWRSTTASRASKATTSAACPPADDRRGGVLGMSGILTYLADGTRTLPVRRATWVLDTLWNQPVPPPPPNVGDLPAIKDKPLSVRERLNQHRTTETARAATPGSIRSAWRWKTTTPPACGATARTAKACAATRIRRRWT